MFGIDFANELERNSDGEFYNRHVMGIVYEFKGFSDGINISIKTDIGYVSFSVPNSQIKYRWYTDMIDWKEEENEEGKI
ncbi:hypothetical protein [Lentilactobacillus kosonis]|nr:hypothetical protein [Lentilactobacillus kosonis]